MITTTPNMTPVQIVTCEHTQKGLDDPTRFGMIVSGWNCWTHSYTYHHAGFVIWYQPFSHNEGVWVARHREMDLRLEFHRDEPIPLMMAVMDQATSDAGDYLLARLLPTTPSCLA